MTCISIKIQNIFQLTEEECLMKNQTRINLVACRPDYLRPSSNSVGSKWRLPGESTNLKLSKICFLLPLQPVHCPVQPVHCPLQPVQWPHQRIVRELQLSDILFLCFAHFVALSMHPLVEKNFKLFFPAGQELVRLRNLAWEKYGGYQSCLFVDFSHKYQMLLAEHHKVKVWG